jgi:neutral ceramidase
MTGLLAGVGRQNVTPKIGTELYGYFNRFDPSNGVHDPLWARAVVMRMARTTIALVSIEICVFRAREVAATRRAVATRCGLAPENVFVFATHSHAAPSSHDPSNWEQPLSDLVADAVVEAYQSLQPAKAGVGAGFLYGYNINRRWMDRPADPAVGVIRIDTLNGQPLAVIGNYACHAVVLGSNNLLISGDWPGYASRLLEDALGQSTVALFSQGGAGDVNPLTETVRQRLAAGHPVASIQELSSYYGYGVQEHPDTWTIDERKNGTFDEAETIARAYRDEVLRVWHAITPSEEAPLWVDRIVVNGTVDEDEPPGEGLSNEYREQMPEIKDGYVPLEVMLVGLGNTVIVGHPGETFSEDSIALRRVCQQMGYDYAMLFTYANGSYAYLPPENAFLEGGYEVSWPRRYGITRRIQQRFRDAIWPFLEQHVEQPEKTQPSERR